jgi:hypothetical protein
MKRINLSPGGLRTDAIVAGDFGVERVRSALVPRGHELTIGRDLIERVVRRIDFATTPATIACGPRRRKA